MNLVKPCLLPCLIAMLVIFSMPSFGQSQVEMNLKAAAQYRKADQELNTVYQKILKEYASKTVFLKKLKTAQKLWVQLRDAEVAARYPESGTYGSAEPMCRAAYLEGLTRDRIKFLTTWLDGIDEGDLCNGSVKTNY